MMSKVLEQILEVRDSGAVNMLDCNGVQVEAFERGLYELVCFIEDSKGDYFEFIMSGDESLLPQIAVGKPIVYNG